MLSIQNYVNSPLSFQAKPGQSNFSGLASGYTMFFTPPETVLISNETTDKNILPDIEVNQQADTKLSLKDQNPDYWLNNSLYPDILTTGPVIRDTRTKSMIVHIFNDTAAINTVGIYVYDFESDPKAFVSENIVDIPPESSKSLILSCPPLMYETRFTGIVPGIHVWTANRMEERNAPLSSSTFLSANTFSHNQLALAMYK